MVFNRRNGSKNMTEEDKKRTNSWAYIYGDEYEDLWEHFGMPYRDSGDRMKIQLIDYQTEEEIKQELKNGTR